MKAVWYERNGSADAVLISGDKPTPDPSSDEVLVRLETSGVNPSDVKSRAGRPLAFDYVIPHSDGAGVIDKVGEGVDEDRIGERVWIWNGQWQRQSGTAAEYISLPADQAVTLSGSIDFATAACFCIPGLTAAHAINLMDDDESETVLVTGAASSVGHYVTQMAVQSGRTVIGTASEEKADIVVSAGATACIDYKQENVGERVLDLTGGKGVGAIIDMDFSSSLQLISSSALQPRGTIYCYGSNDMGALEVPFRDLLFKSVNLKFFLVYELNDEQRQAAISRLSNMVENESLETRISQLLPVGEIVRAHELVESGEANGNVVLQF